MSPEDDTADTLEVRYPWIDWREPVAVSNPGREQRWACRICIALYGLRGWDVPILPRTPELVREHIAREHPAHKTETQP